MAKFYLDIDHFEGQFSISDLLDQAIRESMAIPIHAQDIDRFQFPPAHVSHYEIHVDGYVHVFPSDTSALEYIATHGLRVIGRERRMIPPEPVMVSTGTPYEDFFTPPIVEIYECRGPDYGRRQGGLPMSAFTIISAIMNEDRITLEQASAITHGERPPAVMHEIYHWVENHCNLQEGIAFFRWLRSTSANEPDPEFMQRYRELEVRFRDWNAQQYIRGPDRVRNRPIVTRDEAEYMGQPVARPPDDEWHMVERMGNAQRNMWTTAYVTDTTQVPPPGLGIDFRDVPNVRIEYHNGERWVGLTDEERAETRRGTSKREALSKARNLLLSVLSKEELEEFETLKTITLHTVRGVFRIDTSNTELDITAPVFNVLGPDGKYCAVLNTRNEQFPVFDHYVMQYLMLKHDPDKFIKTANRNGR